jgi:hypothetical protein
MECERERGREKSADRAGKGMQQERAGESPTLDPFVFFAKAHTGREEDETTTANMCVFVGKMRWKRRLEREKEN